MAAMIRRAVLSAMLCTTMTTAPVGAAERVNVIVDQAKVMRIAAPAATVIIGNPSIADATMQDAQTLVITGRSFGTTNLIVLDALGEPIADAEILVEGAQTNRVTVYRGTTRTSFSCGTSCDPQIMPGDGKEFFDEIQKQVATRNGQSVTEAGGSAN